MFFLNNKRFYGVSFVLVLFIFLFLPTQVSQARARYFTKGAYAGDFVKEKETGIIWYIDTINSRRFQIRENDSNLFQNLLHISTQETWPRIKHVPEDVNIKTSLRKRLGIRGLVYDVHAPGILWHIQRRGYHRQKLTSNKDILDYVKGAIVISKKYLYEYPIAEADFDYTLTKKYRGQNYPLDKIIEKYPEFATTTTSTEKNINPKKKVIVISTRYQRMFAYEDGKLVNTFLISSGLWRYPTPRGYFSVLKKRPIVNYVWSYGKNHPDNYDLGYVPYNLNFYGHFYIHYAYWHWNFGHRMSHGCVNVNLPNSKWIYRWADKGIPVIVQ